MLCLCLSLCSDFYPTYCDAAYQKCVTVLFDSWFRSVTESLRQRVLKRQLLSLASCQRNLELILQKQMHLVEMYVLSTQTPVMRQQPEQLSTPVTTAASSKGRKAPMCFPNNCNQNSQIKESCKSVDWVIVLPSAPPNNTKNITEPRPPAAPPRRRKKAPTHTTVPNTKANSRKRRAPQPRKSSQLRKILLKRNNVLIQTRAEDNSRHLSKLIQNGIMQCGSVIQLFLKVRQTSPPHKTFCILVFMFSCHQTHSVSYKL